MRIDEAEEYIGLLRASQAAIQTQVADADEQIGIVRHILDSDGIPEISLSDEDDGDPSSEFHPPSSDFVSAPYAGSDSDFESDHSSSNPLSASGSTHAAASLPKRSMR